MGMDLFELLGIDDPIVKEKKEAPKKEKKETSKKTAKSSAKKVETLNLPATVMIGVGKTVTLDKEGDSATKTLDDVTAYICELTGYPKDIVTSHKIADDKAVVLLNRSRVVAKGDIKITPDLKAKVGDAEVSLASLNGEKKSVAEVEAYIREQLKLAVPLSLIPSGDTIYCIPGKHQAYIAEFPVTVRDMTGAEIVFSKEDFQSEDEEDEDGGNEDVSLESVKEKLFAGEIYSAWKKCLTLYHCEDEKGKDMNSVLVIGTKTIANTPESPKTEMYPTNATITLLFNRIELAPDMFGGKKEVTRREIIACLQKEYPEFTEERTKLTYEKGDNLIFPTINSSTKGATLFDTREECLAAAEEHPVYFLGNYMEDGTEVRYEKTPISVTEASLDGTIGRFQWKLPKIPRYFLDYVRDFFALVSKNFETEALVQIGFAKDREKYVLFIPEQKVDKISVETDELSLSTSGIYHVMDIHSHNTMNAFFSTVDNEDEKANRVYGVMGRFDKDEPEMFFRAATGGRFVFLSVDDVFSDEEEGMKPVPLAEALFEHWKEVVTFK